LQPVGGAVELVGKIGGLMRLSLKALIGVFVLIGCSAGADYQGIVSLKGCSGSIVRFEDNVNSDLAMVLSNGHCRKKYAPREVEINIPLVRKIKLLSPQLKKVGRLKTTRLIYGTMRNTDVSLFQLGVTYQELRSEYGVEPLTVSKINGPSGTPIAVVSGFWRRVYDCEVDAVVPTLKEDAWTMHESLRYTRTCNVKGGTSGSPVISKIDGKVVGVNNTINEKGRYCTLDNPCEVDEQGGVTAVKGRGYAQKISDFYSCRTASGQFDFRQSGCLLPH
jgi:hypothetical protein